MLGTRTRRRAGLGSRTIVDSVHRSYLEVILSAICQTPDRDLRRIIVQLIPVAIGSARFAVAILVPEELSAAVVRARSNSSVTLLSPPAVAVRPAGVPGADSSSVAPAVVTLRTRTDMAFLARTWNS